MREKFQQRIFTCWTQTPMRGIPASELVENVLISKSSINPKKSYGSVHTWYSYINTHQWTNYMGRFQVEISPRLQQSNWSLPHIQLWKLASKSYIFCLEPMWRSKSYHQIFNTVSLKFRKFTLRSSSLHNLTFHILNPCLIMTSSGHQFGASGCHSNNPTDESRVISQKIYIHGIRRPFSL